MFWSTLTAYLQEALQRLQASPQMLVLAVIVLILAATLLLSLIVIRRLFRRRRNEKAAGDEPNRGAVDPLTDEPRDDEASLPGPWKKAPIALARLRFETAPFERPEEPRLRAEQHGTSALPRILYTLPFQPRALLRPQHASICGMAVEAVFFDPEALAGEADPARRIVPFLPAGAGRLAAAEGSGVRYACDGLVAEPDAVIELASGLVVVEVKPKGGRLDDPYAWAQTIREKDILQTLAGAVAASRSTGRPAAAVLRTTNAVYFLRPSPDVVRFLVESIEPAVRLWAATSGDDRPGVAALDFASILSAPFLRRWPKPAHEGHRDGRIRHKELLQS